MKFFTFRKQSSIRFAKVSHTNLTHYRFFWWELIIFDYNLDNNKRVMVRNSILIRKPHQVVRGVRPDIVVIDDSNYPYVYSEVESMKLKQWYAELLWLPDCKIIMSNRFKNAIGIMIKLL